MMRPPRQRIALCICSDTTALREIFDRLQRSGLALGDIAIAGPETALMDWPAEPLPPLRFMRTASGAWHRAGGSPAAEGWFGDTFESGISRDIADNLRRNFSEDACMLLIHIDAPESEMTISRALLASKALSVQFHDLAANQNMA